VNHDIDDAVRAGILLESSLPKEAVEIVGHSASERIGRLVTDVVHQTLAGGVTEIRMSEPFVNALVNLRSYLFDAVYENHIATAEFGKASGILGGPVGKSAAAPGRYSSICAQSKQRASTVAAQDFLAGMTESIRGQALRRAVHSEAVDGDLSNDARNPRPASCDGHRR
jgi:dGTPase